MAYCIRATKSLSFHFLIYLTCLLLGPKWQLVHHRIPHRVSFSNEALCAPIEIIKELKWICIPMEHGGTLGPVWAEGNQ